MRRGAALMLAMLAGCAVLPGADDGGAQLPQAVRDAPERFILVTVRNEPLPLPSRAGSTARGYDVATRYSVSAHARSVAKSVAKEHGLREVVSWPISATHVYCVVFELPADAVREQVIERLSANPGIRVAQPMNTFVAAATPGREAANGYNDPYVDLQRSLREMDVPAAHQWSRGSGVRVAVVDTGVDTQHPDLAGRVLAARNFIDRDRERFERDRHGTEVAGTIAALADNQVGIVGVAPDVQILAYKACWQVADEADAAVCNSLTLAQGISAAIDAQAHVINLSVVGPADPILSELVDAASNRGIVVVGAAPTGGEADEGFPASAASVIAVDVARPRSTAPRAGEGDQGRPDQVSSRRAAFLHAPGDDVFTLRPRGEYGFVSGSSLATAHVSGVVALLLSRDRTLGPRAIRQLLSAATQRHATPQGTLESVNACAAMTAMLKQGNCPHSQPAGLSAAQSRLRKSP
jgi:hypothetical protein